MQFTEKLVAQAKLSYNYLYKEQMEHLYPKLTGVWEDDIDFWVEEHNEQMLRMKFEAEERKKNKLR